MIMQGEGQPYPLELGDETAGRVQLFSHQGTCGVHHVRIRETAAVIKKRAISLIILTCGIGGRMFLLYDWSITAVHEAAHP